MMPHLFFSGASGLILPVSKPFYPPEFQEKSRLCYYSSIFNSIEINSSFYKVPQRKTMQRWGSDVSDGFKFTFKLFQDITHAKALLYDASLIEHFIDTINQVGDKKGCLLVQFPPSFSSDQIRGLEKLFTELALANGAQWKIAVEFRNRSWYNDDTYDLLNQYHISMVVHDLPASATPLIEQDADFIYLRFHGPNGGYRGSYPDDFLSEYASYVKDWMTEGKTVFAYFNNTLGDAFNNLLTFNKYVQQ